MLTIDDRADAGYVCLVDGEDDVVRIDYGGQKDQCRGDALALAMAITRIGEYHDLALYVIRMANIDTAAGRILFDQARRVLRPMDR